MRVEIGALVAAVVLAGCGSMSDRPAAPTDAERGAVVDTTLFLKDLENSFRSGSTAQVTFVVRGPLTLRGRGVVRYGANRMDADLHVDDWKIEGATIDVRTVAGTTYLRTAESRGVWVDVSSGQGQVPGSMVAEEADPRRQLPDLRTSIREVRFSGSERLGQRSARRYQVVTRTATGREITDYWFDRQRRVVRRESDLEGAGDAVFSWSHWGDRVRIGKPADQSVITFERLQRLQQKQGQ